MFVRFHVRKQEKRRRNSPKTWRVVPQKKVRRPPMKSSNGMPFGGISIIHWLYGSSSIRQHVGRKAMESSSTTTQRYNIYESKVMVVGTEKEASTCRWYNVPDPFLWRKSLMWCLLIIYIGGVLLCISATHKPTKRLEIANSFGCGAKRVSLLLRAVIAILYRQFNELIGKVGIIGHYPYFCRKLIVAVVSCICSRTLNSILRVYLISKVVS